MKRYLLFAFTMMFCGHAFAQVYVPVMAGASPSDGTVKIRILEANTRATTLAIEVLGFYMETVFFEGEAYQIISLEEGRESALGKPETPFVSRFLALPADAATPSLEILGAETAVLDSIRVVPVQPKPKRCGPSPYAPRFICDRSIYEGRDLFPREVATIEETGVMRDIHFARIRLNPVQFDPAGSRLIIYTRLVVRINHSGGKFLRNREISPTYESLYRKTFVNWDAVRLREEPLPAVERILVLAPEAFISGAQDFANFKRKQGFITDVFSLSTAGTTSSAIKKFIQARYENPETRPTFIILFGDVQTMPTNHGIGGCASDFLYSTLAGGDYVSDVLVSRFSVSNLQDLAVQTGKVMHYEANLSTDAIWLGGSVCISSSEGEGTSNDDYRSNIICGIQQNYGYNPVNKLYESNGGNKASKISSAINEGRGWVTYLGHGSGTSWVSTQPEFSVSHVQALQNFYKTPFIVDISCDNGAFDQYETCFAEAWLRANSAGKPIGAVAMYSASTPAYWDEPGEMAIGMTKAFLEQGVHRWGEVALAGRTYLAQVWGMTDTVKETFEQYVLFGDASLLLRSKAPHELVVDTAGAVPVGESDLTFAVSRSDGTPVHRALVHVFKEGEVDAAGYTDSLGQVALTIAPETPGDLEVTVTAFDAVPWVGNISAVITGCGVLRVKPQIGRCDQSFTVTLWDQDLNSDPSKKESAAVLVALSSGAQQASLVLFETAPDSGQFQGVLNPASLGLNPSHGASLSVRYEDADCNGAPTSVVTQASFDCLPPAIYDIELLDVTANSARVRFKTNEPAQVKVLLTLSGVVTEYPSPIFAVEHEISLNNLQPSTTYKFAIEARDVAGNVASTPEGQIVTPACTPNCAGKQCGPDGCGGSCGECGYDQECTPQGLCFGGPGCVESWKPGCGGCKCEDCVCSMDPYCCISAWDYLCVSECMNDCGGCGSCVPSCAGKECGDDGCGGSCGTCPPGLGCVAGICQCVPQCQGKSCGPDGCGGSCGECLFGQVCYHGNCKCLPSCEQLECGQDGCGNLCGLCADGLECVDGVCTCVPDCAGKDCGDDGCGGSCGTCSQGKVCVEGKCTCIPACAGKQCGEDGCGGSCGICAAGFSCVDGQCVCEPQCNGKECGPDGCGGSCGLCEAGKVCSVDGRCVEKAGPDATHDASRDADVSEEVLPPAPRSGSSGCTTGQGNISVWPFLACVAIVLLRRKIFTKTKIQPLGQ